MEFSLFGKIVLIILGVIVILTALFSFGILLLLFFNFFIEFFRFIKKMNFIFKIKHDLKKGKVLNYDWLNILRLWDDYNDLFIKHDLIKFIPYNILEYAKMRDEINSQDISEIYAIKIKKFSTIISKKHKIIL